MVSSHKKRRLRRKGVLSFNLLMDDAVAAVSGGVNQKEFVKNRRDGVAAGEAIAAYKEAKKNA